MQRVALIAVLSLVLVGALALVTQAKETLPSFDACDELYDLYGQGTQYATCEFLCEEFTTENESVPAPPFCAEECGRRYQPGTKEYGMCRSICPEVVNTDNSQTHDLCTALKSISIRHYLRYCI